MSRAVELLRKRRGNLREIAEACDVSYSWLSKVSQGVLEDAVAGALERLIEYLEADEALFSDQRTSTDQHVTSAS